MAQDTSNGPQEGEANIVSQIGSIEVDWPRTLGFYGGLALAVSLEMIAPPLAIFIGAYPLIKMLNRPKAPKAVQVVSQVLEGAAKPVGGDAEGTIRVKTDSLPSLSLKPAPLPSQPAKTAA